GHVGAAARAEQDPAVLGNERLSAAGTLALGFRLGDLQVGPGQRGALGGQVEAEPERVRDHPGQRADLDPDRGDPPTREPLGDPVDQAFGNGRLVHGDQQIRGSGSPTSRSTMRVPPNAVFRWTRPGGPSVTWPMTADCSPSGWA